MPMNPYNWVPAGYKKPAAGVAIVVIALVLLFILDKPLNLGIRSTIKKLFGQKGADEAQVTSEDGAIRPGFNPENEAVAIKTALNKWDLPWDGASNIGAFNKILAYTNAELKKVHNAWLTKFKGDVNDTLRKQVEAETAVKGDTKTLRSKVLARLDKLSL